MFKIYTYRFSLASFDLRVIYVETFILCIFYLDQSLAGLHHLYSIYIYELGRRFSFSIIRFPYVERIQCANFEYAHATAMLKQLDCTLEECSKT